MKKLKSIAWLVLVVLTCAAFVACDDDDDEPEVANELIGKWLTNDFSGPEVFIFKKNGTFEAGNPDDTDERSTGTYKYDEENMFLQLIYSDGRDCFDVQINGDRMYWDSTDKHYSFRITFYRQ